MPIPSTGWLPTNQNQGFEGFVLPTPYIATYSEGGDGTIVVPSSETATAIVLSEGAVTVSSALGFDAGGEKVAHITFERTQVYGYSLLDVIDIPDILSRCFPVAYTCYVGTAAVYDCLVAAAPGVTELAAVAPSVDELISTEAEYVCKSPDVELILPDACIPEAGYGYFFNGMIEFDGTEEFDFDPFSP